MPMIHDAKSLPDFQGYILNTSTILIGRYDCLEKDR
jgi:hypothetical protein